MSRRKQIQQYKRTFCTPCKNRFICATNGDWNEKVEKCCCYVQIIKETVLEEKSPLNRNMVNLALSLLRDRCNFETMVVVTNKYKCLDWLFPEMEAELRSVKNETATRLSCSSWGLDGHANGLSNCDGNKNT